MRRTIKRLVFLVVLFGVPASSASLWARATSATSNLFLPAVDDSPYLTVYGSQTLQPWRYQFGSYFNYARNPLEVGLGGVARTGIVDHLVMGDFFGSLGVTDWFQLGLNVPVALYEDFNHDFNSATPGQKTIRMGDIRFETKFRLLDIDRHNIGLSFLPYLLAPTGAGSRFVGNNSFAGGAKMITDVNIRNRIQMSLNLGYLARDRFAGLITPQDDQFTYGLGMNIKAKRWLRLITEVYGATNVNNFFGREAESPLEVDAGLRFYPSKPEGLAVTVGGGVGMTFGWGAPDFRAILGVTYPNPKTVDLQPRTEPLAVVKRDKIVITKKVHFEFDRAVIRPISFPILDAVVAILKDQPSILKVRIEGHTDSKGKDAYNMKLSQRRTNAVRDYLTTHGISVGRLIAAGYGETRPLDSNDTPEGRARNRRVEFTILEGQ